MITFVESAAFTSVWSAYADPDELHALLKALARDSRSGVPLRGCSVLRKVRFPCRSMARGSRGGLRVIYMHTPQAERVDLLAAFAKSGQSDISGRELKAICKHARAIRARLGDQP